MNSSVKTGFENIQLLPLTSDIVFKQVFGQEESKPILRVFLNDILGLDIQSEDQITLLNPEINPGFLDDKMCILDVRIELSDRSSIDIEIQVLNQHNMEARALYYACQLCTDQLHTGEDYSRIAPVYGLNLLCFNLYKDERYYRSFVLKDDETNETYRKTFEIDFFELRKAVKQLSGIDGPAGLEVSGLSAKEQWALFLDSGKKEVYEKLGEEKEVFEEAYERLIKASSDQTLMEMYRSREKAIRDWNNSIHSAKEEGEKKGIEKGESRIGELYKKLLQDGREDDISHMMEDAGYRAELYKKYGML